MKTIEKVALAKNEVLQLARDIWNWEGLVKTKVANLEKFSYRWYTGILIGKLILPVQQPKIEMSQFFEIIHRKSAVGGSGFH